MQGEGGEGTRGYAGQHREGRGATGEGRGGRGEAGGARQGRGGRQGARQEGGGERTQLPQRRLVLLALVVDVAVLGEARLGLELEEGVVEDLVVDVDLAHLGLHPLLLLALELLRVLLLEHARADLLDASRRDELGKLEGGLFHPALAHQKLALLAPVLGHGDGIAVRLEVHEQPRVVCRRVPRLRERKRAI